MALVRGVICLSLSDWAPAVAPSLAPLHSALLGLPLLTSARWVDGWTELGGGGRHRGTEIETRTRRGRGEKSLNSQQEELRPMRNAVKNGLVEGDTIDYSELVLRGSVETYGSTTTGQELTHFK